VVAALRQVTDDFEIVVVDDGSRDRTAEVVRELTRLYPEVRLARPSGPASRPARRSSSSTRTPTASST
jgi:glycosyltransferase involved in cell wall biosynthesis